MIPEFETREALQAWMAARQKMRQRFYELLPTIATKDGLVPSSELITDDTRSWRLRKDKSVEAVPHWRVAGLARRLLANPALWKQAAIRVEPSVALIGRAPMFGVSFLQAIKIALRDRLTKSRFWIPPEKQDRSNFYAQLLVKVSRRKESNGSTVAVESWEWVGDGIEVDYAHMILEPSSMNVLHIDGALVHYDSEAEVASMFETATKHKGCNYEKYFRVDGTVSVEEAIAMIRDFFPIQELVEEYFQYLPKWPAALDRNDGTASESI